MALQNFVARSLPTISANWLNAIDRMVTQSLTTSGTDTGVVNTAVVTLNGTLPEFVRVTGTLVTFVPAVTNTGPATLNVNGTGAAAVVNQLGNALTGGEFFGPIMVAWTGTQWKIFHSLVSPAFARTAAEIAGSIIPVNYLMDPGNVLRYGNNTVPGTTNMTAAFQAASDQSNQPTGARPYAPSGSYLITSTVTPGRLGFYGDGPPRTVIYCDNCDLFTIPANAGWDRPQTIFEKFSVNSNNGTSCDDNWVFMFPGVAASAAASYNSGFIARDIAIGRINRFGGGFRLKDVFGAKVQNISMTDITRAVQLVGSVVQSTFTSIDALLGNSGAGSALTYTGFSTESATYSSGATTLTPEHITTHDLSLIVFATGVDHTAGLDISFYDTDIQATSVGMSLNAPCEVRGGIIIPHSSGVTSWTGVRFGVNPGVEDARFVTGVEVSMGNTPGAVATSYGFDIGDGASPAFGVVLKECSVKGNANSLQNLIRARIPSDLTITNCHLEAAVSSSTDVLITSAERLNISFNQNPGGTFSISDGGSATASGVVLGNQLTTLTLAAITSPQNWAFLCNSGQQPVQFGWEQNTFPITLTGCVVNPTGTARWTRNGRQVMLFVPGLQGVSNAATASLTGVPAVIRPNRIQEIVSRGEDNSVNGIVGYRVLTTGTIDMFFGPALGGWTAANNKGTGGNGVILCYSLD